MNTLQSALEESLSEAVYQEAARMMCAKLEAQGVTVSQRETDRLAKHLSSETDESFRFSIWSWWKTRDVAIDIKESDVDEIQARFESFLNDGIEDLIRSMIDELSPKVLGTLRKRWKREARRQLRELRGFNRRLKKRWGPAIDRLRMSLTIARELGQSTSEMLRRAHSSELPHLADVLPRLHARACQVTDETICLLESGFADGAMARWRTLHETAAVALLLAESGEEVATRYVDHQVIESYRAATDYRSCSARLGYDPMGDSEYQETKDARDQMIERYGPDFDGPYGWATEAVGKSRPTIRDIEEAAGIDHLRAHYRMASHNVHANPKGVFFRLGLLSESDILLAGPSNFGLADPGHSAAISLAQVTAALCLREPNLDILVSQKLLGTLIDEIGDLFFRAQSALKGELGGA